MKNKIFYLVPYGLWLVLFVGAPIVLMLGQSFLSLDHHFTLSNYQTIIGSGTYLQMMLNSIWYAFLITLITLVISFPTALFLTYLKNKQFWLLLIILPTWINLLLKTYAFIGLLSQNGSVNKFIQFMGFAPQQLLFTSASFILVAAYIEIPFMILPIYNSINEIDKTLINASYDLGATRFQTFWKVILPLSADGIRSGIQAVFIPSLSLFMITRLIGGNRVITLGTAIEEHFLVTQNWGLGSTIGVILIVAMLITMFLTRKRNKKKGRK